MMGDIPEDVLVRVSTQAADDFVKTYYQALDSAKNLASFYIQAADIWLNGNNIPDPQQLQTFFKDKVGNCQYDAQSHDCSVLNQNCNIGAPDNALGPSSDGSKMSILVLVSGSVKYKDSSDEARGFTESFTLVPNFEPHSQKAPKGLKKWLIQSQTFRLVV
ncbi:hypothetical protein BJ878DRAFT_503758 [Calycina marina]|uniref:NTF2 domain-containing protein n=1 Tax=Calycina marina TaxID=1763456 RepID=A0A9P7Z400_9HELO|nr:hypothetical protein BJ878DRAFT_503758 [Calycina marina]